MKLIFVTASSSLPDWLEAVKKDYEKKLSFWFQTEVKCLSTKASARSEKTAKIKAETEKFLEFICNEDYVVLCDENGKAVTSMEFSKKMNQWMQTGKKRLIFIIGGAYGVGDAVKNRADFKIKLSEMILNHHLAMAVILEQVYRAMTILKGIQYHNE